MHGPRVGELLMSRVARRWPIKTPRPVALSALVRPGRLSWTDNEIRQNFETTRILPNLI